VLQEAIAHRRNHTVIRTIPKFASSSAIEVNNWAFEYQSLLFYQEDEAPGWHTRGGIHAVVYTAMVRALRPRCAPTARARPRMPSRCVASDLLRSAPHCP
jgi:hypothetical protein